jgi:hypothetical protein
MGANSRSSLLGGALGRQRPGGACVVDGEGVGREAPEVVVSLVHGRMSYYERIYHFKIRALLLHRRDFTA